MRNLRVFGVLGLALALAACGGGGGGGKKGKKNSAQSSVPVAPGAVPGLRADPADAQVKLTWSVPVDGGIPVAIKVYRAAGATPPAAAGSPYTTVSATQLEYTDTTVSNYQSYSYVVLAANDAGDGPPSNPVAATPMAGLPGAPTGLAASNGDGQVALSWSAPPSGGAATQYRVYRGQTASLDATWSTVSTVNAPLSTVQDTGLANFTAYGYVVRAVNPTGEGPPSTVALGYPNNGVPGMPQSLAAEAGNQQVHVSWSASADGGDTQQYTAYRGAALPFDVETWLAFSPQDASATTLDDTTAVNWVTYSYVVMASNPIGSSPPSNAGIAMPNNGAPGTPQNVAATAGDGAVTVIWDPPLAGAGDVFQYTVSRCEITDCMWSTIGQVDGSALLRELVDAGVVNFTSYQYRVAASNPIGQGSNSAEIAAMPNNGVPGVPQSLTYATGDHQVTLSWQVPQSGGDIYEYRVYRSTNPNAGASGTLVATLQPSELTYVDNPANPLLDNYTLYYYAVAAWNPVGQGPLSDSPAVMPGLLPGTPLALEATSGNHTVALAWSAPASGDGGQVDSYSVYRSDPPDWSTFTGPLNLDPVPANQKTFTDASASNYQTYYYRVVATNPKGDGSPSAEVFAYPKDGTQPVQSDSPPALGTGDQFGRSVGISGSNAIVGAPLTNRGNPALSDAGAIHFYRRSANGSWTRLPAIEKPSVGEFTSTAPQFGHAVAISGDMALAGAPAETWPTSTDTNGGRVYVYRRQTDGSWAYDTSLFADRVGAADDQMGYSVALSGNFAIVGARQIDTNVCGRNSGAVYVFEYAGTTWSRQLSRLAPFATCTGGTTPLANAEFGFSVAISGGNAVVGAPLEDVSLTADAGAVYFLKRLGTLNWNISSTQKFTGATPNGRFGWSVAMSGNLALVGAPYENCPGGVPSCNTALSATGSVRAYQFDGTAWVLHSQFWAPTAAANDNFGQSVAMSGQQAVITAGALSGSPSARRVYTCQFANNTWNCGNGPSALAVTNDAAEVIMPAGSAPRNGYVAAMDGVNRIFGIPFADIGTDSADNSGDIDFY